MKFYDCKNATLGRKICGFPLIYKNNVATLLVFNFPLIQKKTYRNVYNATGGGGIILDYTLRICGIKVRQTKNYKKLLRSHHLYPNTWFQDSISTLREDSSIKKIINLTQGLDKKSASLVCRIIARTLEADAHPLKVFFTLSKEEIEALDSLQNDFVANIFHIAPNLYYWNGYFLPCKHIVEVFWYRHGLDSLKNPAYFKHKDIIDVGGYIGDSATILSEYTEGKVHSFETTSHNYNLMLETIRLNHLTRVVPIKKGLGSVQSKMTISIDGPASSFNPLSQTSNESEEVEIITLDSYVAEHKIQVGFIKVDIEGFEMEFLKGAKHTICTQKPTMLISIYHSLDDFFEIKPLIESWNLGYTFSIHKPIDYTISVETGLFCEIL